MTDYYSILPKLVAPRSRLAMTRAEFVAKLVNVGLTVEPLSPSDNVIVLPIAFREDRQRRTYELFCALRPFGWRLTWDYWKPGEDSRLRCAGPYNDEALKIVQEWAATMPILVTHGTPQGP